MSTAAIQVWDIFELRSLILKHFFTDLKLVTIDMHRWAGRDTWLLPYTRVYVAIFLLSKQIKLEAQQVFLTHGTFYPIPTPNSIPGFVTSQSVFDFKYIPKNLFGKIRKFDVAMGYVCDFVGALWESKMLENCYTVTRVKGYLEPIFSDQIYDYYRRKYMPRRVDGKPSVWFAKIKFVQGRFKQSEDQVATQDKTSEETSELDPNSIIHFEALKLQQLRALLQAQDLKDRYIKRIMLEVD